ncbi:hypothetical protein ABT340_29980 [Streptosporangium sp. NPDC000239]|uniref:hypothetical protein n=1 Tax=Streptosporangium sp. NPDC000239 TaxID=3154248 RepID=UPI003317BBF5
MTHDVVGEGLVKALAEEGVTGSLIGPTTVGVSYPGVSDFTIDIGEWRARAAEIPPAQLPSFIAHVAQGFARSIRAQAQPSPPWSDIERLLAEESLRMRLYTEEALSEPPGLRDALLTRALAPGLVETVVVDTPDSIVPLNRSQIGDRPEEQVFGAALHASLTKEPHYAKTDAIWGVPITHVGETHRYVGSHIHVLRRHVGAARYGALVSFPVPEYLIVHEIGDTHIVAALEAMQELTRTHVEKGDKALTAQVYWWFPGAYERLPEPAALASGQVPDLRPVEVEVNHREKSVTPLTADTGRLIELWMSDRA